MRRKIFFFFSGHVLQSNEKLIIFSKSDLSNCSNKLVHMISEMQRANLIFIKINSNFSELFFSQNCFNICNWLLSINWRFIIKKCSELNALYTAHIVIPKCTEFTNITWTFNLTDITLTWEINWEEMFSFGGKLSYLLVVAWILDIHFSQHKVFGFKFVFFLIKSIVLVRYIRHHRPTQRLKLLISIVLSLINAF